MRTLKKMLSVLLLLSLSQIPIPAWGAETCQVTLPEFKVTVNGEELDNSYSKYPLLLYKDITYFPLTYYDCRLLGVSTAYDQKNGLALMKDDSGYSEYLRELTSQKNAKQQTAQIAQGPITIGGQRIDNAEEDYPFLLFRNVTYMPLTWKYAAIEFGWQYSFDLTNGLVITGEAEPVAAEPELHFVDYPSIMGDNGSWRFVIHALQPGEYTHHLTGDYNSGLERWDISFYNFKEAVYLHPIDPLEYRVYRKINGEEHLVYRQRMLLYSGEVPSIYVVHHFLEIPFWESAYVKEGEYMVRITYPENFIYSEQGSDEILLTPFNQDFADDNYYYFNFETPVRVVK